MDLPSWRAANPVPFAELLGIEIICATPDRIVGAMVVREEFSTVPAVAHGGAIMAFADTLGALATVANLPGGGGTTTLESKTNFVAAAPVGTRLKGDTTAVHRGRRTMVWQTRIQDDSGKLIAVTTQTQLVL